MIDHKWVGEMSSASYCSVCGQDYRDGPTSWCSGEPKQRESELPRRRFVLVAKIGADSQEELSHALRELDFEVSTRTEMNSTSGGVGYGWHVELTEDPSVTHETYFAALEKWRIER